MLHRLTRNQKFKAAVQAKRRNDFGDLVHGRGRSHRHAIAATRERAHKLGRTVDRGMTAFFQKFDLLLGVRLMQSIGLAVQSKVTIERAPEKSRGRTDELGVISPVHRPPDRAVKYPVERLIMHALGGDQHAVHIKQDGFHSFSTPFSLLPI